MELYGTFLSIRIYPQLLPPRRWESWLVRSCKRSILRCIFTHQQAYITHHWIWQKIVLFMLQWRHFTHHWIVLFMEHISRTIEHGKKQFSTFHASVKTFHASLNMAKKQLSTFHFIVCLRNVHALDIAIHFISQKL